MHTSTNNTLQSMFTWYDQNFEAVIAQYDKQHEDLNHLRGKQYE